MTSSAPAFGEQLRIRRERLGLSVRAAALAAGVSEALWRQYEKGERQVTKDVTVPVNPTVKNVRAMADAVGWVVVEALEVAGFSKEAQSLREAQQTGGLSVVRPIVDDMADEDGEGNPVIAAVLADPFLDEESRAHYLNQYAILRDRSILRRAAEADGRLPYAAHGKRTGFDPELEKRLDERSRQLGKENPHSPYRGGDE